MQRHLEERAFTLIELLVVIAIIIILAGLLFPAFSAVQNQARRTQAKNDLTQIVTAVNAYYTEYGQYPLPSTATTDTIYGPGGSTTNNALFNELRACTAVDPSCSAASVLNTRKIVYISPPAVKDPSQPKSGIGTTSSTGQYFDPWGTPYNVEIDGNYDNQITTNPYLDTDNSAGGSPLHLGVIGWSYGSDTKLGINGNGIYKNSDDVISWQ